MTNGRASSNGAAFDVFFSFMEVQIEMSSVGIEYGYELDYPWNDISIPTLTCGSELFNVLNLFAHLLNQHFQIHGLARRFCIRCLRRECIGFAVELLHQKIQTSTGW